MYSFLRRPALMAALLALWPAALYAADPDAAPLSLQQAIAATLQRNPELIAYPLRQQALAGARQGAALQPGFNVYTQIEDIGGSDDYRWLNSAEMTLSLSSVLELGGKRDARLGVVSAREQELAALQHVTTLEVLTALAQQFISVLALQEQVLVAEQALALAGQTREVLATQVAAGLTPEAELLRATAVLAQADIDLRRVQQRLQSERVLLAAWWAEPEPDFTQVSGDLLAVPAAAPLNDLLLQLEMNPDLAQLASVEALRTAELREAHTQRDPNLQWNAGVRRLQSSSDTAFVVGLTVPLGTAQRASGAIAEALARQGSAALELDSMRVQLQARLRSLHAAHTQALDEISALQSSVLPPFEAALTATEAAFEQGRYSYLELTLAQQQLLAARQDLIAAAARAHALGADIERLTGAAYHADPAIGASSATEQVP